ncbi:hypothetical protein EDD17DRAFT_1505585 [Pisolithus thermaeus]|nr:hypothetical protein EDD17DRAFT_1505585 [Pisolithus thermaeus]
MDGRGDPPPKENSHHIPEGPPEVQKDNKETNKKGKALQTGNTQEDTSTNQPGAAMPMPGGLRLSMTLGSSTNQVIYTKGNKPSMRGVNKRDTPIDPHVAVKIMNEFLLNIEQQWLDYRYGPKEFHNHGVNPGEHHAKVIACIRCTLSRRSSDDHTSRAGSPNTEIWVKKEEISPQLRQEGPARRGNPPNRSSNTPERWQMKLQGKGNTLLEGMEGRKKGTGLSAKAHMYGGNPPNNDDQGDNPQGYYGGRPPEGGPPVGDDPNDGEGDKINIISGKVPQVSGRPMIQGNQPNYLRGYTPGNMRYMDFMQHKYAQCIWEQVGLPTGQVGPEVKAMSPLKPGKYGGQDDLENFNDWLGHTTIITKTTRTPVVPPPD